MSLGQFPCTLQIVHNESVVDIGFETSKPIVQPDHIGDRAQIALRGSLQIGRNALRGELERPNGNGGRTVGDRYYPPQSKGRSR